jgi:hypothetical protein
MGEVVRFVPKSERERARLIREARAIYDGIFPPANSIAGTREKVPLGQGTVSGANADCSDGVLRS